MNSPSLSGGRHVIITDAQIAARDAYIDQHTNFNVYEDMNIFVNRYLDRLHGGLNINVPNPNYDPSAPVGDPRALKEIAGMIDFSKFVVNTKECASRIKSEEQLRAELIKLIKDKPIIREHYVEHKILEYLRQKVPNNENIDDKTLLNSPDYTNIRAEFSENTAFEDLLKGLSTISEIVQLETKMPDPNIYTELRLIMESFNYTCADNIAYRILSTCDDYIDRVRISKRVLNVLQTEFRSEILCPYDTKIVKEYSSLCNRYTTATNADNNFIVYVANEINWIIDSFLDLDNLNALKAHFPHHIPLHPQFNHASYNATINLLFTDVRKSISEMKKVVVSQYDYMYYDVRGLDVISKISTENVQTMSANELERIEINLQQNHPDWYDRINLSDMHYHPNAYYHFDVPPDPPGLGNTANRNLQTFFDVYFRSGRRYNKPLCMNRRNNAYNMQHVYDLMITLFVIETIATAGEYMQIMSDYISYIIEDRNVQVYDPTYHAIDREYRHDTNGIQTALAPFIVRGGEISDLIVNITHSLWFRGAAILCLIVLLIILIYKISKAVSGQSNSSESFKERMDPTVVPEQERLQCDHEREYQVYEYVNNQVECDAEHLKPTNAKRKVKQTRKEDPSAAVNVDGEIIENNMLSAVVRTD